MDYSMPGLPVHQLPEFVQTHSHLVGDVIQPSRWVSHFHCKNIKLKISGQQIQSGRLLLLLSHFGHVQICATP